MILLWCELHLVAVIIAILPLPYRPTTTHKTPASDGPRGELELSAFSFMRVWNVCLLDRGLSRRNSPRHRTRESDI